MKRGMLLAEVLVAGGLSLALLTLTATQLLVFWQTWQGVNTTLHQRQWAVVAFEYLERDQLQAGEIICGEKLLISGEAGTVSYNVTAEGSFYRRSGETYFPLAYDLRSASWRQEGPVLWLALEFSDGDSYRTCFRLPEGQQ